MSDANNGELSALTVEADEAQAELRHIIPKVAEARRTYFRQRSDQARNELEAMEQQAAALNVRLTDVAKRMQEIVGVSDDEIEALEREDQSGDSVARVHRGQLTTDKIKPSASIERLLEASLDKLLATVGPHQLKQYEKLPVHRLIDQDSDVPLSLVRGIRPESESPGVHRFAQALQVTQDFMSEHPLYDHFAGALLVPQVARLADRLALLDGVPGASKRLKSLWRRASEEVDSTIFELLVGAGCIAMGRTVEFLDAKHSKSPDLMCHDPFPIVIECKRKRVLSTYEIEEERYMRALFMRLEMAARAAGMWGSFILNLLVEARDAPLAEIAACFARQRFVGGNGKAIAYDWGSVAWVEAPRRVPLPRPTRLYSPNMLHAAFDWNPDLAAFDGLICRVANSPEPVIDSVEHPVALLWTNVSAQALKKRSWGPMSAVTEALDQVPAGDFGIVYVAVQEGAREQMADSRTFGFADWLKEVRHRNEIRVPLCKLVRLYPRALGDGMPDLIESTVEFVADYSDTVLPTIFPSAVFTKH
jgi:hypothetical protein